MQQTKNISYSNTNMSYIMRPSRSPNPYVTVSGRDASWFDADGTVTPYFAKGTRVNIGSNFTGPDWWRYNDKCVNDQYNWICPMDAKDSQVSLVVHWADSSMEKQIGSTYCNGGTGDCPLGAVITHFNRDEYNAFEVALSSRVTGPVIDSSGGWFVRFLGGTPQTVSFTDMQIDHNTVLHLAIPYPAGTTFNIYAQAPSWCVSQGPPYQPWYPVCQHPYRQVNSIDEVRNAWGDTYYFDQQQQLLHIRIVSLDSFGYSFGTYGNIDATLTWYANTTRSTYFSRGGLDLLVSGVPYQAVVITATSGNCQPRCPNLGSVSVPGIKGSSVYTGPPQTPNPYTTWGGSASTISFNLFLVLLMLLSLMVVV